MKDLQVEKKAEESLTVAAGDGIGDSVAAFTSQNRKSSDSVAAAAGRFRACVSAFGTVPEDDALRQHFQNCGEIEGIVIVEDADDRSWCATISFANLESIFKALQLNKTSFRRRPLNIFRERVKKSTFEAGIHLLDTGAPLDVVQVLLSLKERFEVFGEIEDIRISPPKYAYIDFASLASLDKALEIERTEVCGRAVAVMRVFSNMGRFRAEIHGFDTGADTEKVEEALRKHFKGCGKIEGISVGATYACIDFESSSSLFKALELDNTEVGDHPITVRQPGLGCFWETEFKAGMRWSGRIKLDALRSHFEKCRAIAGIEYHCYAAVIHFTNMEALNSALELDGSSIGGVEITVVKHDRCVHS